MKTDDKLKNRPMYANKYTCRVCGAEEIRHFLSAHDFNMDIVSQNSLCIRCYVENKFDADTLIPHKDLPVLPVPEVVGNDQSDSGPIKRGRKRKHNYA